MKYLERFKARAQRMGQAYANSDEPFAPNRPIADVSDAAMPAVNALVDIIIGCNIRGEDFEALVGQARVWAAYEWPMVEPLIEAARNPMGQTPQQRAA